MVPFAFLIVGHQSFFDLDFLKYINDKDTHWNMCIRVPYGTALWQVGDSNQQNGRFKMLLTQKKKEMYQKQLYNAFQQNLHLMRSDIVPLVNATWPLAFGNVESKRRAITERGWGPFNKNLLLHPLICTYMTETMMNDEIKKGIFPIKTNKHLHAVEYVHNDMGVQLKPINNKHKASDSLNFNDGIISKHIANTIILECNRQKGRERNKKLKIEGKIACDRILGITKKMTAGKLVLEGGSFIFDDAVYEHGEQLKKQEIKAAIANRRKKELLYMKHCYLADEAMAKCNKPDVKKW